MTPVEFHFDFGSPNAYFAHRVIPGIEERTGVTFTYVPVLLGGIFKMTNNQSPMAAFANIKNKMPYERLEMQRFIARHQLTRFRMNPHFPVNTLLIMRAAAAAEMAGTLMPYAETMFRAMWEDGEKMDDPAIAAAVLGRAGLDAGLLERAQEAQVKDHLMANTQASVERGTFGAPTFFVGKDIYFGKDRLRDVEEAIRRSA